MILTIEQAWGKWPGWFATLGVDDQADLIAHRRVQTHPGKKKNRAALIPQPPRGRGR